MDKIPTDNERSARSKNIERVVLAEQDFKKRFFGSFFEIAGATVSIFIVLAVILITTTDIHLSSFEDFAGFTLDFFLLLFCSYAMYVNSADTGMRAGLKTDAYINALADFNRKKREVIDRKFQARLPEFCHYFIVTELYNTRNAILAIVGFPYAQFAEHWLGRTEDEVNAGKLTAGQKKDEVNAGKLTAGQKKDEVNAGELTAGQKKAIIKANATEPVKLTPEMMMKRGRSGGRRDPLGVTPEQKKTANFITRFFTTFLTAIITSMIALDAITDPTWTVIVTCIVKLLTIVMNATLGYKFGYENIVIDTVEYMESQTDLLRQSIEYCESTPSQQE